MVIGLLTLELRLTDANSLKDKRRILKSQLDRIRNRHNVSAIESGRQDFWRAAELSFCCIGTDSVVVGQMLNSILDEVEANPAVFVAKAQTELL